MDLLYAMINFFIAYFETEKEKLSYIKNYLICKSQQ